MMVVIRLNRMRPSCASSASLARLRRALFRAFTFSAIRKAFAFSAGCAITSHFIETRPGGGEAIRCRVGRKPSTSSTLIRAEARQALRGRRTALCRRISLVRCRCIDILWRAILRPRTSSSFRNISISSVKNGTLPRGESTSRGTSKYFRMLDTQRIVDTSDREITTAASK